jgi:hypothetical protein
VCMRESAGERPRERKRGRERGREGEREGERERQGGGGRERGRGREGRMEGGRGLGIHKKPLPERPDYDAERASSGPAASNL